MAKKPSVSTVERPAGWLEGYPVEIAGGDLYGDASGAAAVRWKSVAEGLAASSDGDLAALQDAASRHAQDLGLAFRVTGDEDERGWPITAMPLVISADEWATVERGLIQRATMFEQLAADVYGEQRLVKEGHLPAAVVAGSPFFARKMLGNIPPQGNFLHVYSADLARGPRGQWRVLQDRVRIAAGVGHALENRLTMLRASGSVLADNRVRRVSEFFALMRDGMAAACGRDQPRIALLTPGRFNQSYAEQAHLARYLGFPLVEGRDLSVMDNRLYVGTIAGPKRVDAVWRWINTTSLDPLSFDSKSQLGVANLFEAWAAGGVGMVNWPGAEVLETPAFAAFMPRLCKVLLGEEPMLPNIATWWCGQVAESATVSGRLDELALLPAFGLPVEGLQTRQPVAGASLEPDERQKLLEAMQRRPMDYCGQEIVHLSTTPAVIDGAIVPRPFTVRAFVARTADGQWSVMPGGLARLSSSNALPTSLMGAGDLSADVWVVDQRPAGPATAARAVEEPAISRGGGILASQAADNLFWFGRYNERAETVVRIVRTLLGSTMEGDIGIDGEGVRVRGLVDLLLEFNAIAPATAGNLPAAVCARALTETRLPGGVAALMRRRMQTGLALRERFARDFWRIVSRPMPSVDASRPQSMLASARWLTEHFSALAGLVSEDMVRSAAWRFLQIGHRIERGQAICRMASKLSAEESSAQSLGMLLDLCDSQIIYRSRYLTGPMTNPVRDLVLLDPDNPRALKYQVAQIVEHLSALPSLRDDNIPEPPLRAARALAGELEAVLAPEMTPERLETIEKQLQHLSDEISERYFLKFDREEAEKRTRLL
ncbi:circularly permuted type 2 ATP-grasp protein [Novosphingobium album (ex Hu et al. 2023)]|uniref:Circularly permuted type 2 ATP-grasp protein n=1 Tax=Novosphingobium album (ex Hu et al. 2023) TaxID=2930093 RepID=A0ABT0B2E6_9SPHN|nr:circularly permuted type 2 ATP-grasp protein [Novosphingobium album (ex Hu et al. 2023)]MCJ2179217.1 circularly permuted type 2 ATP-grasp protein [Novosphingobium album (ex Hu et al. 2023)]